MNDELEQQLLYMEQILWMHIDKGPNIWDFSDSYAAPRSIDVNGEKVDPKDLYQIAIKFKKDGNYASAVGAYSYLIFGILEFNGQLIAGIVRGLIKVLLAANEYFRAFTLISTMLSDMYTRKVIDIKLFNELKQDFNKIKNEVLNCVDNGGSYNNLLVSSMMYSGSLDYMPIKSGEEIKKELKDIRKLLKEQYGM